MMHRIFSVLVVLSGILIGCQQDVAVIWSAKVESPDGKWLAVAETEQHGGPGTAGIVTEVRLRRETASASDILILELFHNEDSIKPIDLRMNWRDRSHLQISYTTNANVDFEAIKCCGTIQISLVHRSQ
jgi:hypothetical protein